MNIKLFILFLFFSFKTIPSLSQDNAGKSFDFFGDSIVISSLASFNIPFNASLTYDNIQAFYQQLNASDYSLVIKTLLQYKAVQKPDDWLFYQLIRKTAQAISPKAENYHRYTLYKWFLLTKTGYDAVVTIAGDKILFYVQCNENIYEIPFRMKDGKQYVCLNYHDYGEVDFKKEVFSEVLLKVPEAQQSFSYTLTKLPKFSDADYVERELNFRYNENEYRFKIKLNPQVKNIFANYPVVDYGAYFNTPLSSGTYQSLIPSLKKQLKGLNVKNGVDYLMRFTRYAFLFKPDVEIYGKEKRLLPEQTLLYEGSDCEDRAALFFYLVKEIYNLPMIVLAYPKHVTIAVKLDKPIGQTIVYNGSKYSVCESTPQKEDLSVGQLPAELRDSAYEVAYAYNPETK